MAGTTDYGYTGDGGPALAATFEEPDGVTVDAQGRLFISDAGNSAVRKVDTNGVISTVINSSVARFPYGIAADPFGGVYIAYPGINKVLKLGGPVVTSSQALALPSNHACTSRRAFAIHVRRVPGLTYQSATVSLQGRRVPVYVYAARRRVKTTTLSAAQLNVKRFRAVVDLRGRVRGTYKVRLTVTTSSGQVLNATRTYHTCSRTGRLSGSLPRL